MKILFIMMHPGYVRNYESVLRLLAQRGHRVYLHFNSSNKQAEDAQAEKLCREVPNVVMDPKSLYKRLDSWNLLARIVRGGMDYLRYFHPKYAEAVKLRERIEINMEARLWKPFFKAFLAVTGPKGIKTLHKLLTLLEKAIPPYEKTIRFLSSEKPDVMMVTPLVNFRSDQTDYFRAAAHLGIRSVLCVASWDNLTNKGLIRISPDRVFVWNQFQREEAAEFHGIPLEKVVVTGAQCYDKWYEQKASATLEEFCRKVGLAGGAPYLLYLCSSPFIARHEVEFVQRWIEKIRNSSDSQLRNVGILVRPHPQNAAQWKDVDFSRFGNVAIYPRGGANPVNEASKADFYDSMFHSLAVVGINTSSMIEAGILDKSVHTVMAPEFKSTQSGTLHFHYLSQGGLLHISGDLDDHLMRLSRSMSESQDEKERRRAFIKNFIRPHGISTPCTPLFVDALEKFVEKEQGKAQLPTLGILSLRAALWPLAFVTHRVSLTRKKIHRWRTERKLLKEDRRRGLLEAFLSVAWKGLKFLGFSEPLKQRIVPFVIEKAGSPTGDVKLELVRDCRKKLADMAKSSKPIVVGPWLSEVGFEVLYWIPFLNWAVNEFGINKDRLIVISRGGAEPWYRHFSGKYIDVLGYFSQEEFKAKNLERIQKSGGQKHVSISDFDMDILRTINKSGRLGQDFDWLHPSLMYNLFKYYWMRRVTTDFIEDHTRYQTFGPPAAEGLSGLPDKYVAVKFYFSEAFPDTRENRSAISGILSTLSERNNVVLLNTGLDIDDHKDCARPAAERLYSFDKMMTLKNNLTVQTQIISRAQAFYGTYGGFSYLAPFYGVPSISFYSREDRFLPVHLDIAHRAFRTIKYGRFDKIKNPVNGAAYAGRPEFMALNLLNLDILRALFQGDGSYDLAIR